MDNLKKHSKIILDFTELEVYKLSFEAAMQIYDLSKKWPQDEKYSLINQIRRSSRSVCSNIAEAWRKMTEQEDKERMLKVQKKYESMKEEFEKQAKETKK